MKRGTYITKRYNRNKQERHPPLAQINNNCNPLVSYNIDERTFKEHILPTAIANNWCLPFNNEPPYTPNPSSIRIEAENGIINIPNKTYTQLIIEFNIRLRGAINLTFADNTTQTVGRTASGYNFHITADRDKIGDVPLLSKTNIIKIQGTGNLSVLFADILYAN